MTTTYNKASLNKRLLSALYEIISLMGICLVGTAIFTAINTPETSHTLRIPMTYQKIALQITLFCLMGLYLVWCWRRSGQTLAMKTWRLRLVSLDQKTAPSWTQLCLRYSLSYTVLFGFGFLWALIDRDHLCLHERLSKTKIISTT